MNRVVVFQKIAGGQVEIVRPVPWARLVASITENGETTTFNPPQMLERVSNVRDIERYADLLDAITAGTVSIDWETEDAFCTRICEERTAEIETAAQVAIRVTAATNARDRIPFARPTGNLIRKIVPDGVAYTIVDATEIPTDRKQRMALTLNPQGRPVIDPTKLPPP